MLVLNPLNQLKEIFEETKTIAVVGLSPKEARPSNDVARYLIQAGYDIIPVNPGHDLLLGRKCYPDLISIPFPVDLIDIFRRSEDVPPIVQQAVQIGCKTIWMQQGIVHLESAEMARKHNVTVIMDRCIKTDHIAHSTSSPSHTFKKT